MRDDPIDWTLLERYVAGDCSPAERRVVSAWVSADPERTQLLTSLHTITSASQAVPRPVPDSHTAWRNLDARMTVSPERRPSDARRVVMPRPWPMAFAAVAAVAIVVVAGGLGYLARRPAGAQTFREFVTPAGGRATVVLRDGTQLTLGPATRLEVPTDFGRSARTVVLNGEAMFSVVHNATHPFTVHVGQRVITDVGTRFDVRAYPEDTTVRVAVAEGMVSVGVGRDPPAVESRATMLHAGDVAIMSSAGMTVAHDVNVAVFTVWTQGGLAFRDAPFAQVIRDVARRFDLHITVADSTLNGQLVTATFSNESVDEVLDEVTHAVGARYERVGQQIVVRRRTGHTLREDNQSPHAVLRTARAEPSHQE